MLRCSWAAHAQPPLARDTRLTTQAGYALVHAVREQRLLSMVLQGIRLLASWQVIASNQAGAAKHQQYSPLASHEKLTGRSSPCSLLVAAHHGPGRGGGAY